MPPLVALLLGLGFVCFAFWTDRKRDTSVSKELFWPTLWYMVVASRPFGVWLSLWGVPLPGGSGEASEGSIVDRYFYLTLTVLGLRILIRRQFSWAAAFRANRWLTALLLLMAVSVLWSSYPFVSFKRYIKVVGSVVMALVVLTHEQPFPAFLTVLRRCLYVHLPFSIICIKYYRHLGVSYDWFGNAQLWQGISTSKNTLGQVAVLGVVYFFWEVRRSWPAVKWKNLHFIYLAMAIHLLRGSPSAISVTSVSVCVFALLIFLRVQALRNRPWAIRPFVRTIFNVTMALVIFILSHSVIKFSPESVFGNVITAFGRDITLTDRTHIWDDVYREASRNPLLGVGYGGFWIGRDANIGWNASMTWVLGQAHNGYVDTYLQIGIVGLILLFVVFFTTLPRLIAAAPANIDFACFKLSLLVTLIYINITESTFLRGDHHLWFVAMLILWQVPDGPPSAPVEEEPPPDGHQA